MKCRPGDMAVIVADPQFNGADLGALVDVLHAGDQPGCWMCRAKNRRLRCLLNVFGARLRIRSSVVQIPDAYLHPIRPPGLTQRHQTRAWAPSALEEKA